MKENKETLKNLCEQAVQSHPAKMFTVDDIIKTVQELKPKANPSSIRTCIQRDLKGNKMIHVAAKKGIQNLYSLGSANGKAIGTRRRKKVIEKTAATAATSPPEPSAPPKDVIPSSPLLDTIDREEDFSNGKIVAKSSQENELTFDSFQIGESVIAYIAGLRKDIVSYRIKLADMDTKLRNTKTQYQETIKEQVKSIETLNDRIRALNNIKRSFGKNKTVNFKMDEVARISKSTGI